MSGEPSESVELERHAAHLSPADLSDAPYTISGIAIGEGDVTRGQSGIKKKWTREALEPAAESLEGRPLVVDHDNTARGVVGEVTRVAYQPDTGVLYQAELDDEELAEKVANGRLEVSIRGFHEDTEEMQEDAETGAKLVTKLRFANLSIVPKGAAPSNTVEIGEMDDPRLIAAASEAPTVESGPSTEVSAAECAEMLGLEDEDVEENAERSEGAEEHGNPEKYAEQPERFPEEDDTPSATEEAGEQPDGDEEMASNDDATSAESQSDEADDGETSDVNLADVKFIQSNMDEDTEEKLSEYSDPHVIEGDELSELRTQAEKVADLEATVEELSAEEESDEDASAVEELKEQFEADLSDLKERTNVLDEVDRSDVESLAEADEPLVVEQSDYDELSEEVETVREHYAEELSEHLDIGADRIAEKWSISEMKADLAEYESAEEEADDEEDLSPDLKGDDAEEEDLEEAAEKEHEETEEELSEDAAAEQERLREKILG